ncbi:FtsX-like permease family protein [Blautia schinkii]|nr:FtsX-like permease family protein [Blautia schinkii]
MKNYLDLVPISAKVHRKQSRMSVICIVLAVFLVTAIFGMADMFIRSQILQTKMESGSFHIGIRDITDEDAALIAKRKGIKATARYGTLNFSGAAEYTLEGKKAIIAGCDEAWVMEMLVDFVVEGNFPQTNTEAMITQGAQEKFGLGIGDRITIKQPDGEKLSYTISGFCAEASKTRSEDASGIFITTDAYRSLYPGVESDKLADYDSMLYVQFTNEFNAQKEIADLKEQYGLSDEQVSENTKLLGLLGQSGNSFMGQIYMAAGVLFVLVLISGIMMIASSLNSNVAQRTEFFGLMRCVGATPKQVMRLVRKEALRWCRFAIPAGIVMGIAVIWVLCAVLRFLSPAYFGQMPVFGFSIPSICAGIIIGVLTVMLAARSPARRAARVSPLAAVSGNANELMPVRRAANTKVFKIDAALGVHHAKASRKNLILMAGSFALSIILFLSFSVTVEFMNHALTPLRPWTSDLSIISPESTCSVDHELMKNLQSAPEVKTAYGRMFAYDLPITVNGAERKADLISYEEKQFEWAEEYLLEGSIGSVINGENTGLMVFKQQNLVQVGDTVVLNVGGQTKEIQIAGILSDCPFNSAPDVETIICSEDTFRQVTGETDYTIIDVQLTRYAGDDDVSAIRQMAGPKYTFADERMKNSNTLGTYYCFWLFVYGFLVLIALITVFNIINSIAMSVSARTKQYGAFRAIGLSTRQLRKMVAAEAAVYTGIGGIIGTIIGLICNKTLFRMLVSFRWGNAWVIPWEELGIILLLILLSMAVAVQGPVKKIQKMSIVDTISAQ